jgi:hypothetical protein
MPIGRKVPLARVGRVVVAAGLAATVLGALRYLAGRWSSRRADRETAFLRASDGMWPPVPRRSEPAHVDAERAGDGD